MALTLPSYLIAFTIPRRSRGAGAFTPAYNGVPGFTYNGFAFRPPRAAPALTPRLTFLPSSGLGNGPVFVPTVGGQPLTINPYATS